MIDNNLDKVLREKLDSYQEQVDSTVWTGIEGRLNKRRNMRIVRNVAFYSAAAAACLLAGLFFFKSSDNDTDTIAPVTIAEVTPSVAPDVVEIKGAEEIQPIEEQIKNFGKMTAENTTIIDQKVKNIKSVEGQIGEAGEKSDEQIGKAVGEKSDEQIGEKVVGDETEKAAEIVASDVTEKTGEQVVEESLPMGYWESWEDENDQKRSKRNTSLAILSNLSSVSSDNSFIVDKGPSHSSSQTGETPGTGFVQPIETPQFYMPVSLGIQVKTALAERLYIGAGVNYTYLLTKYDAMVNKELFKGTYNQLHYVGVPINLYYNFVNTSKLGVYANLGGAVEKCVSSHYIYGSNVDNEKVKGLQYSANIGIGIEYWLINRMGIYFDPSIAYFFDNSQPLSLRTAQPLQMRFELGFRFKI